MSAIIFCGPTLSQQDCKAFDDFVFRSPVRQGALYSAVQTAPKAIGIIDGYFDGQPAVWHKEILWALSQGIEVFGAASMGALRAAELQAFGMRGIGSIYEDYRDGVIIDDDEVALMHGPEESGYAALSDPLVNIRATIAKAIKETVITAETGEAIITSARLLFYKNRSWDYLLQTVAFSDSERKRLISWLSNNKVNQKRLDALEMLNAIRAHLDNRFPPQKVNFNFEWTENWDAAPWRKQSENANVASARNEAILDELKLEGSYKELRRKALLRLLVREEVERTGSMPSRDTVAREISAFRTTRGFWRQTEIADWAQENDMDSADVAFMLQESASIEHISEVREHQLGALIIDLVREGGRYAVLRKRAEGKNGWRADNEPASGMSLYALLAWFFHSVRGEPIPSSIDEAASLLGMSDKEKLTTLLEGEFWLLNQKR